MTYLKIPMPCWLAGLLAVCPFFFFFFLEGNDENFTKSRDCTKTLPPPRYLPALPGYNRVTLHPHLQKIKVALFRTHVTVTEPFVYTHPPTTISGLPRPDQPPFFLLLLFFSFASSVPWSFQPTLHSPF